MALNPWRVQSIDEFNFFCCPECVYRSKEENSFQTHALQNHELSSTFFHHTDDPKTIETGMILSIDQAAATRYICRNQPNPSQNLFCSHSINIHVCSHYVLRVLITCLWDPRCHPYVFESRIA